MGEICISLVKTAYFIIPILGAVGVALLNLTGEFSPGLKGVVEEVDEDSLTYRDYKDIDNDNDDDDDDDGRSNINALGNNDIRLSRGPLRSLRKAVAAIITLGTGNSLGPEGPGVEIGVAICVGLAIVIYIQIFIYSLIHRCYR